jgi:transglutaminase-like putative cysteine protease
VETLQTPKELLRTKQGDCDDKATLLATMLQTIGFPTRFCAVGVREGPYSHVLVEAKAPGHPKADRNGWVALETILPGVEPGWFPPDATRKMVAHVS